MSRFRLSGTRAMDLRTSGDDRDAVIALLTEAFAHGRLEAEEFDVRVDRAMRTGTYRELHQVLDGLPIDRRRLPHPPRPRRRAWVVPAALGAALMAAAGTGAWLSDRAPGAVGDAASSPAPSTEAPGTPSASPTEPATPSPSGPTPEASSADTGTAVDDGSDRAEGTATPDPTVDAVTRSGSGTRMITVPWSAGVMPMIEFRVDKPQWTTFSLSDSDGSTFFTYIAADGGGGRTTGTTVMPAYAVSNGDTLRVKVETEGTWTLTLRDADDAPDLQQSGRGSGYQVLWHDGPEAVLSFSAGDGLYSVSSGYDLVVSGVGPGRDEGVIPAGRHLMQIEADSPWRYEMR